jgi:hypothetical protein
MLTIKEHSKNRVDIELDGKLDADDMRVALEDLIAKSETVEQGRMLYTIREFALPTMGAIGVEITLLPKLFGLLGRYDKCAVVTDSNWLRKAALVEGALVPGLEINSFEMKDMAAAEAWLEGE